MYHIFDELTGVGLLFVILIFLNWLVIAYSQYRYLTVGTLSLQTKSTQTAFFLPMYALITWIGLFVPDLEPIMEIPMSIIEAHSFYGFTATVVQYLGGPSSALVALKGGYHHKCGCLCPVDPSSFYSSLLRVLWLFLYIRVPIIILLCISEVKGFKAGVVITKAIATTLLIWTFVSVIQFYHSVMEKTPNCYGFFKLMMIKTAVGLVVFQGIILTILELSDKIHLTETEHMTSEQKATRVLEMILLAEFLVLCIPQYFAFGTEMPLSDETIAVAKERNEDLTRKPENLSFISFLCGTFNFFISCSALSALPDAEVVINPNSMEMADSEALRKTASY